MIPYEVVKTKKKAVSTDSDGLKEERFLVMLLPIRQGNVIPTQDGWMQIVNGKAVAAFKIDEIVWMFG